MAMVNVSQSWMFSLQGHIHSKGNCEGSLYDLVQIWNPDAAVDKVSSLKSLGKPARKSSNEVGIP